MEDIRVRILDDIKRNIGILEILPANRKRSAVIQKLKELKERIVHHDVEIEIALKQLARPALRDPVQEGIMRVLHKVTLGQTVSKQEAAALKALKLINTHVTKPAARSRLAARKRRAKFAPQRSRARKA